MRQLFHVTRPTRKVKGKPVTLADLNVSDIGDVDPINGAQAVKLNGNGQVVDLHISPITLPETKADLLQWIDDNWATLSDRDVHMGYATEDDAMSDGDVGSVDKQLPLPIQAVVYSLQLWKNAEVNARLTSGGASERRIAAELHWVSNDKDGYVKMVMSINGSMKEKNKALDSYASKNGLE